MTVTGKAFDPADETRTFDHGKVDVIAVGGFTFGKYLFEPGWRWSTSVKPIAKTDSCQAHHAGYILSGTLHVETEDGTTTDIKAGQAYEVQPGHDAWVVGDEAVTSIEFMGAEKYAAR
jgi:hypothetical protein